MTSDAADREKKLFEAWQDDWRVEEAARKLCARFGAGANDIARYVCALLLAHDEHRSELAAHEQAHHGTGGVGHKPCDELCAEEGRKQYLIGYEDGKRDATKPPAATPPAVEHKFHDCSHPGCRVVGGVGYQTSKVPDVWVWWCFEHDPGWIRCATHGTWHKKNAACIDCGASDPKPDVEHPDNAIVDRLVRENMPKGTTKRVLTKASDPKAGECFVERRGSMLITHDVGCAKSEYLRVGGHYEPACDCGASEPKVSDMSDGERIAQAASRCSECERLRQTVDDTGRCAACRREIEQPPPAPDRETPKPADHIDRFLDGWWSEYGPKRDGQHEAIAGLRKAFEMSNAAALAEALDSLDSMQGALDICMQREEALLRLFDPEAKRTAEVVAIRGRFSTSQPLRDKLTEALEVVRALAEGSVPIWQLLPVAQALLARHGVLAASEKKGPDR